MSQKQWTVMIYMAGDNNLSEDMITALVGLKDSMKHLLSESFINLLAIYDSGHPTIKTKIYNFTIADSDKSLETSVVRVLSEETVDIVDFVAWSAANYPAQSYALILSGHSDGIIGRTIMKDESPTNSLNLRKLAKTLRKAKKELGKRKFALLGFDSCLMSMAEVGSEFKDIADVIVASEGSVPTSGWCYENIFTKLFERGEKGGEVGKNEFAKTIVREFHDFSGSYKDGGRSTNISACDLRNINQFERSVAKLGSVLCRALDLNNRKRSNAFIRERLKRIILFSRQKTQSFLYDQAVDVIDLVKVLSSECLIAEEEIKLLSDKKNGDSLAKNLSKQLQKIRRQCAAVERSAEKYVFANASCGAEYQFSHGISIFFPWSALALFMVLKEYRKLQLSIHNKEWLKFIGSFVESTFRPQGSKEFSGSVDLPNWSLQTEALQNKDVSFRDVSFRDVSFRDVSFRDVSFRDVSFRDVTQSSDKTAFYDLFRRTRNFPIDQSAENLRIKDD